LQQPQERYSKQFPLPKIVYPIIAKSSRFALDRTGAFINDKAYSIPVDDLYLLGVLNSASFWRMIVGTCSPLRGGFFELRVTHIGKLPVPVPKATDKAAITSLVHTCMSAASDARGEIEREIDNLVSHLYGESTTVNRN
jgi:hypothetical protein